MQYWSDVEDGCWIDYSPLWIGDNSHQNVYTSVQDGVTLKTKDLGYYKRILVSHDISERSPIYETDPVDTAYVGCRSPVLLLDGP